MGREVRSSLLLQLYLTSVYGQIVFPGLISRFGVESSQPFLPVLSERGSRLSHQSSNNVQRQTNIGGVLVSNAQIVGPPCATINGAFGDCRTLNRCVRFVFEIDALLSTPCPLPGGERGVCCPHILVFNTPAPPQPSAPSIRAPPAPSNILQSPPEPDVVIPDIRPADISAAITIATKNNQEREKVNQELFNRKVFAQKGTSVFSAQKFKATNKFSSTEGKKALLNLETSVQLSEKFSLSRDQGTFALPKFTAQGSSIADTCPVQPTNCIGSSVYRTIDGSCNNLNNTSWGKSNTPLQRLLPPVYEDGIEKPRQTGLPSARAVSALSTSTQDKPDPKYTLMLMQWGQFVDHDITHTPTVKGTNEVGIVCCGSDGRVQAEKDRHRECFPIDIPSNDRLYAQFQQTCMEFVRSMPAPRVGCSFGPREQINQITAWMDGSNVYGSDNDSAKKLRLLSGGRLRVTKVQGRDLLPLDPKDCSNEEQHRFCFAAGDLRVNEQIDLTVTHTLWMREHNRVADQLLKFNPNWNDEKLYQEARRIVIAQLQHITYNEWLPIILGIKYMQKWRMQPAESGFSTIYDQSINPTVTNVFASAAFRFGHSLIQGSLESFNLFGTPVKKISLTKTQFAPFDLYDNQTMETFVRGLTTQKAQSLDMSFSEELTGHLFQQDDEKFGMDLVALNIQRARDHGIPPYMEWRKLCGLETFSSWKMLTKIFDSMVVARLQSLYKSVEDIDIFVGGIMEEKVEGEGLLGPTFQCLLGDQFARLKAGDRFWFENAQNRFTLDQLNEIRQTSLARVFCENVEDIGSIQPLVFITSDINNRRASCESEIIPRIDLSKWREA